MLAWNLDQACFLATEPGGQDLADWARENDRLRTLPLSGRLRIALQIAAALQAVHSAGVLHGELKPGNILIATEGEGWRIRLADFGSGALLDVSALERHQIDPAGLAWDPRPSEPPDASLYLAPERRDGAGPTQGSEVYALGYLTYQLLAGDLDRRLEPGWERDIEDPLLQADIVAATERDPDVRIASVDELIRRLSNLDERRREQQTEEAPVRDGAKTREPRKLPHGRLTRWGPAGAVLVVAALLAFQLRHAERGAQPGRAESEQQPVARDVPEQNNPVNGNNTDHATLLAKEKEIATLQAGDPDAHADALLALSRYAYTHSAYDDAERVQRSAIQILTQTHGPADTRTLTARYLLTYILDLQGRYDEAGSQMDAADRDAAPLLKIASEFTLRALQARAAHHLLLTQPVRALHWYEEAEAVRLKVAPDDPILLQLIHGGLAWCYVRTERSREALQLTRRRTGPGQALQRRRLADWVRLELQRGIALRNLGRFAEAEQVLLEAERQSEQVAGQESYFSGVALFYLAGNYQAEGHLKQALDIYRKSEHIISKTTGQSTSSTLEVRSRLAAVAYLSSSLPAPEPVLADLQSVRDDLVNASSERAAPTQLADYYLAAALCETGRAREAELIVGRLDPKGLAAADASEGWNARLAALHGHIIIGNCPIARGGKHIEQIPAALKRGVARDPVLQRLQQAARAHHQ
jgi:non-specific serine/threonine protein kinase